MYWSLISGKNSVEGQQRWNPVSVMHEFKSRGRTDSLQLAECRGFVKKMLLLFVWTCPQMFECVFEAGCSKPAVMPTLYVCKMYVKTLKSTSMQTDTPRSYYSNSLTLFLNAKWSNTGSCGDQDSTKCVFCGRFSTAVLKETPSSLLWSWKTAGAQPQPSELLHSLPLEQNLSALLVKNWQPKEKVQTHVMLFKRTIYSFVWLPTVVFTQLSAVCFLLPSCRRCRKRRHPGPNLSSRKQAVIVLPSTAIRVLLLHDTPSQTEAF